MTILGALPSGDKQRRVLTTPSAPPRKAGGFVEDVQATYVSLVKKYINKTISR